MNLQEKLNRIRRPRVHITYDLETEGAEKKIALPFVVGVITWLSGDTALDKDRTWKFNQVDNSNIDNFLNEQKATLNYFVPNIIVNKGSIEINLQFKNIDSLNIINIVEQIPELNEVYNKIRVLSNVALNISNNPKFAELMLAMLIKKNNGDILNGIKEMINEKKT